MSVPDGVLVVGASSAGLAAAEALRRKGYGGPLTILGGEPHLPYDRPPLSKQVLSGAWEPARARLRTEDALSKLDATFVLGDPAVGLDVTARAVRTAAGRVLGPLSASPALGPGESRFRERRRSRVSGWTLASLAFGTPEVRVRVHPLGVFLKTELAGAESGTRGG